MSSPEARPTSSRRTSLATRAASPAQSTSSTPGVSGKDITTIIIERVNKLSRWYVELDGKYNAQSATLEDLQDEVDELRERNTNMESELKKLKRRVVSLENENRDLWNEIYKIRGPVFPQAVFDVIIDFLHADKLALGACALTCRSWLPASRYHLFQSITFTPTSHSAAFESLLSHPLRTFTPRTLCVDGKASDEEKVTSHEWLQPLVEHLHTLPAISTLQLHNISHLWYTTRSKSWERLWAEQSFLNQITILHADNPLCYFNDMTRIGQLLPSLARLVCTCLIENPQESRKVINFTGNPPPKNLYSISLKTEKDVLCANYQLWIWFTLTSFRSLQEVELTGICARDFPSLAGCLDVLGKSIRRLKIGFFDVESRRQFCRHKVLAKCTALETLQVNHFRYADGRKESSGNEVKSAIDILRTLPSPKNSLSKVLLPLNAEDMTFSSIPNFVIDKRASVFLDLDRLLTGAFPFLTEVKFDVKGSRMEAMIAFLLPICSQLGLVGPAPSMKSRTIVIKAK